MIITIQGYPGEGKSKLAEFIAGRRKSVTINEHHLVTPFGLFIVDSSIEVIIVDDVMDVDGVNRFFSVEHIKINRPAKPTLIIPTPDVIIIKR